jgi:hypothetical protein
MSFQLSLFTFFLYGLVIIVTVVNGDCPANGNPSVTLLDIDDLKLDLLDAGIIGDAMGGSAKVGSLVRLIFHDCGGRHETSSNNPPDSICDGCLDFSNTDHAGLASLIVNDMDTIFLNIDNNNNSWCDVMSRTDFWITSAILALESAREIADDTDTLPDIPFYFGRRQCSTSPDSLNTKDFPSAVKAWNHVKDWFNSNFPSFTNDDIVAILGAHTLGGTHSDASGFVTSNSAFNSWVTSFLVLDNDFYVQLLDTGNNWQSNIPAGKWLWTEDTNRDLIMLNTDIAMVRNIEPNVDSVGQVSCDFSDTNNNGCGTANVPVTIAERYKNSNQKWLDAFAQAFEKMITVSYDVNNLEKVMRADDGDGSVMSTISHSILLLCMFVPFFLLL